MNDKADILYPTQGETVFDPQGSDYDYDSARAAGMGPTGTGENAGHWGSVVETTEAQRKKYHLPAPSYMLLKGASHETWGKAVAAEADRGFVVKQFGDRYFSVPESATGN